MPTDDERLDLAARQQATEYVLYRLTTAVELLVARMEAQERRLAVRSDEGCIDDGRIDDGQLFTKSLKLN
jgi:hypothetical protein